MTSIMASAAAGARRVPRGAGPHALPIRFERRRRAARATLVQSDVGLTQTDVALNVSHSRGSPFERPRLNHRMRWSDVPCVNVSAFTRPVVMR